MVFAGRGDIQLVSRLGYRTLPIVEYENLVNSTGDFGKTKADFLEASIAVLQSSYEENGVESSDAFHGCIASYIFANDSDRKFMEGELEGYGDIIVIAKKLVEATESERKNSVCCIVL
ncbi:MAG: hypothetical protein LBB13_02560 [Rickettsiales bacterium]|jgi:hypothetical protein|nr:hypothetical protein [Rickettsiales bacterium]